MICLWCFISYFCIVYTNESYKYLFGLFFQCCHKDWTIFIINLNYRVTDELSFQTRRKERLIIISITTNW